MNTTKKLITYYNDTFQYESLESFREDVKDFVTDDVAVMNLFEQLEYACDTQGYDVELHQIEECYTSNTPLIEIVKKSITTLSINAKPKSKKKQTEGDIKC